VGVVGKRVMATDIALRHHPGSEGIVDFRHYEAISEHDAAVVDFRAHELPAAVERRCRELVRRLGLQYAMFDLARTPDGEYVFLEANTKGMFGEVGLGGHDAIGAMADLLLDPEAHKLPPRED
jgi:hypothetical protein